MPPEGDFTEPLERHDYLPPNWVAIAPPTFLLKLRPERSSQL